MMKFWISSLDEFREEINGSTPVVVDFWAPWCGPCRFISPVFEQLSDASENGGLRFLKADVDQLTDVGEEAGIRAAPTFMVFKDGMKEYELLGADSEKLRSLVSKAASMN